MKVKSNRRMNRSEDVQEALSLQLAASTERASFSSMVLADELGTVLAMAGNRNMGEELAAISPILAPTLKSWHGTVRTNRGDVRLAIAPIRVHNSLLYVSATHGDSSAITRELFTSGRGITRILA